jgi:5-methylcytosine-specific restriction endonuclease McrA
VIRPLLARKTMRKETPEHRASAATFRLVCFSVHGYRCFYAPPPGLKAATVGVGCLIQATDPGHIIPRSALGPKTRYVCPKDNSRPLCRVCHNKNYPWPLKLRRRAAKAINRYVDQMGWGEQCKVREP